MAQAISRGAMAEALNMAPIMVLNMAREQTMINQVIEISLVKKTIDILPIHQQVALTGVISQDNQAEE